MSIGGKIKRLRLKLNLTQEELANRTELSKGFISQLERLAVNSYAYGHTGGAGNESFRVFL